MIHNTHGSRGSPPFHIVFMKTVILDAYTANPGDLDWSGLKELGALEMHDRTPPGLVLERAAGAQAVLTNKTLLDGSTIRALPTLQYIGVLATGYNVIDVAEATRRSIVVTSIPTYGTDSVAQHATALILELDITLLQ